MARGSRSNTSRSNTSAGSRESLQRPLTPLDRLEDALSIPLPSGHFQVPFYGRPSWMSEIEDGRVWHPDPDHGALTIGGRWARVVVHQRPFIKRSQTFVKLGLSDRGLPIGFQVPVGRQFVHPWSVINCVRRKTRRMVLFARRKTGKGQKQRMPKRTWRSEIWC